jgi:histidine triad (HIT) family protein
VIVIPNGHFADLREIPEADLGAVYGTAKRVAAALHEVRECDGTSTRQHNGSGAGQDVFHFHVHVFPRFAGDGLYARDTEFRWASAEERAPYAERLREALG